MGGRGGERSSFGKSELSRHIRFSWGLVGSRVVQPTNGHGQERCWRGNQRNGEQEVGGCSAVQEGKGRLATGRKLSNEGWSTTSYRVQKQRSKESDLGRGHVEERLREEIKGVFGRNLRTSSDAGARARSKCAVLYNAEKRG